MKKKVLLIYTGGTIGMVKDYTTDTLKPFDFDHILNQVPELANIDCDLETAVTEKALDSSDMKKEHWIILADVIGKRYSEFDGFVVLHGTDTMAYAASALSFLLENLDKPVIFTGSQLPIGIVRTDGKENLITAIEIASSYLNDRPLVPEVAIYFEYSLYRGNRSIKVDAQHFKAFESPNFGMLAQAGVSIEFNKFNILKGNPGKSLKVFDRMDNNVALIKLFPDMRVEIIEAVCNIEGLKALVIESYGSGNAPSDSLFLAPIKKAIDGGLIVLNISQCIGGSVHQGKYHNSKTLEQIGVLSGGDLTTAAGITKLMYLLSKHDNRDDLIKDLLIPLRGEMS